MSWATAHLIVPHPKAAADGCRQTVLWPGWVLLCSQELQLDRRFTFPPTSWPSCWLRPLRAVRVCALFAAGLAGCKQGAQVTQQ